jgi:hypothetical protein
MKESRRKGVANHPVPKTAERHSFRSERSYPSLGPNPQPAMPAPQPEAIRLTGLLARACSVSSATSTSPMSLNVG